jgi:hypothetical protein
MRFGLPFESILSARADWEQTNYSLTREEMRARGSPMFLPSLYVMQQAKDAIAAAVRAYRL